MLINICTAKMMKIKMNLLNKQNMNDDKNLLVILLK